MNSHLLPIPIPLTQSNPTPKNQVIMSFYTLRQPQAPTSDAGIEDALSEFFQQLLASGAQVQAQAQRPQSPKAHETFCPPPQPKSEATAAKPARPATRAHCGDPGARPAPKPFTPAFDLLETSAAFILEGELPGLTDKKAVVIEFVDPQTLLIKGRIERTKKQEPQAAPAAETEGKSEVEAKPEVEEKTELEEEVVIPRPRSPPRPTVEDEVDEDEDGYSTIAMTPSTSSRGAAEAEKKIVDAPAVVATKLTTTTTKAACAAKPQGYKLWVSERTVGSFQRTFRFPGLVEQDGVTARLENGILRVEVPKRKLGTRRRIVVM